jgi:hypothetical protein
MKTGISTVETIQKGIITYSSGLSIAVGRGPDEVSEHSLPYRLLDGRSSVGTLQLFDSTMVSEIICIAGMDFVIYDRACGLPSESWGVNAYDGDTEEFDMNCH